MALSELEGRMYLVEEQRKKFLLNQLELKATVEKKLQGVLSPLEEQRWMEAKSIIENNIQRMRVEGLL